MNYLFMVQLILNYGPDLRIRNCQNETASDIADKLDENDEECVMIFNLINKKMKIIRCKTYSYLRQSWIMSGPAMTHMPCPPTKKCRYK